MDKLNTTTEVLPASIQTWDTLQNMILLTQQLCAICGDKFILSGCEITGGTNVAEGYVVIDKELFSVPASNGTTKYYINESRETVELNGEEHSVYIKRKLVPGTNAGGTTHNLATFKKVNTCTLQQLRTDLEAKAQKEHAHKKANITDFAHTHPQGEITNLTTALGGKAATEHTHAQSEIEGLGVALSGKAAVSHTHAQSEIGGLGAALSGKAATSHTHAQSEIGGLGAALSGKAATSHTHDEFTIGNVPDGSFTWVKDYIEPLSIYTCVYGKMLFISGKFTLQADSVQYACIIKISNSYRYKIQNIMPAVCVANYNTNGVDKSQRVALVYYEGGEIRLTVQYPCARDGAAYFFTMIAILN